jgi:hypothetical protein
MNDEGKKRELQMKQAKRALMAAYDVLYVNFDHGCNTRETVESILNAAKVINSINYETDSDGWFCRTSVLSSAIWADIVGLDIDDVHPYSKGGETILRLLTAGYAFFLHRHYSAH